MSDPALTTTSASLSRNFGLWQDKAMTQPVMVTHHGRPRAVLISVEEFHRLTSALPAANPVNVDTGDTAVLDCITQGFVALDANFITRRLNRAAMIYFGRSAEALIGRPLTMLYPSLQEAAQSRVFGRVMRTGEHMTFEVPSTLYPGQQLKIEAFPYDQGVGYLFQAVPDEELQKDAAETDALKWLFAAHGAAGTARLTLRGTISRIDDTLLAMTGHDRATMISAALSELVMPEDRPAVARALDSVLDGHGAASLPISLLMRNGDAIAITIALAETRGAFAVEGAALLVTPRAPD